MTKSPIMYISSKFVKCDSNLVNNNKIVRCTYVTVALVHTADTIHSYTCATTHSYN